MKTVTAVVCLAVCAVWAVDSSVFAGDLFGSKSGGGGCNCGGNSAPVVYVAPVSRVPVVSSGCGCCQAAACCSGLGGGLAQIGGVYGVHGLHGLSANSGHAVVLQNTEPGFLSGYEGLPSMDGGGVHYRYPYHSYRRPWAHPGTPSTNISIVW